MTSKPVTPHADEILGGFWESNLTVIDLRSRNLGAAAGVVAINNQVDAGKITNNLLSQRTDGALASRTESSWQNLLVRAAHVGDLAADAVEALTKCSNILSNMLAAMADVVYRAEAAIDVIQRVLDSNLIDQLTADQKIAAVIAEAKIDIVEISNGAVTALGGAPGWARPGAFGQMFAVATDTPLGSHAPTHNVPHQVSENTPLTPLTDPEIDSGTPQASGVNQTPEIRDVGGAEAEALSVASADQPRPHTATPSATQSLQASSDFDAGKGAGGSMDSGISTGSPAGAIGEIPASSGSAMAQSVDAGPQGMAPSTTNDLAGNAPTGSATNDAFEGGDANRTFSAFPGVADGTASKDPSPGEVGPLNESVRLPPVIGASAIDSALVAPAAIPGPAAPTAFAAGPVPVAGAPAAIPPPVATAPPVLRPAIVPLMPAPAMPPPPIAAAGTSPPVQTMATAGPASATAAASPTTAATTNPTPTATGPALFVAAAETAAASLLLRPSGGALAVADQDMVAVRRVVAAAGGADEVEWAAGMVVTDGGRRIVVTSDRGRGWLPAASRLPVDVASPWAHPDAARWEGLRDPARVIVEYAAAAGGELTALASTTPAVPGVARGTRWEAVDATVSARPDLLHGPTVGRDDLPPVTAERREAAAALTDPAAQRRQALWLAFHADETAGSSAPRYAVLTACRLELDRLGDARWLASLPWERLRDEHRAACLADRAARLDVRDVAAGAVDTGGGACRPSLAQAYADEVILALLQRDPRRALDDAVYSWSMLLDIASTDG